MTKTQLKRFGWNCSRLLRRGFEFLESRHLLTAVTTVFLADPYPNQAPKVFDRFTTVEINTPTRTPNVLYGQFDVETDPLSVVSFTNPAHGTIVLNSDATFTYTPATNYKGADSFQFSIGDGRGGLTAGTMNITVIQPSGNWSTTSFSNLGPMQAGGAAVNLGSGATTVPRAVDFNGDGLIDVLAGSGGSVWLYQNSGTATNPLFDAGVKVKANSSDITVGNGRVALSYIDMNGDGLKDLIVVGSSDLKARYFKNIGTVANPVFSAETILKTSNGTSDFVLADIRADVADWNGDGLPDIVTGSWAGSVKIAYNVGSLADPKFGEPVTVIDSAGRTMSGAYNLNVRIADVNQDGIPDLLDSYNWGNINYRVNTGTTAQPLLPNSGTFNVTNTAGANVDFHALADGPIVDFADVNGDGTIDLIAGGENAGTIFIGYGQSGQTYLNEIDAMLAAHPNDLGPYLADASQAAEKTKLKNLEGALYDYVVNLATPSQRATIYNGLLHEITTYPQYFKLQKLSVTAQPGIPSLAAQTWLTALLTNYYDPATRIGICNAAQFPARNQANGAYRKLVEDIGLILMDDMAYGNDAEAVYQWVRNVPRDVYPGTGITNDWLGGRVYLVRGHLKNIFTGYSDDGAGEYGFGSDAYAVIGDRGSENWYMTVVHHEAMHDMDAYVNQFPDFRRRWGQILVYAAGHDAGGANYLKEDPNTGWYSESLTQTYWKQKGWWNGTDSWSTTLSNFYTSGPGAGWENYGFMRGGITSFFIPSPQESLATQANQFWNSGEGRIQTAINRWYRGYDSDITEVLFYLDVLSQGFNKMQLCENDNYSNQVISYAQLHRNAWGYIDQVTVNGRSYQFTVNDKGRVTNILSPLPPTIVVPASASPNPVIDKTTGLSVLGDDDGGGANLIYTWSSTGPAAVAFSANGTNSARSSIATFIKAGNYSITATIADQAGLTVASTVNVTVDQMPTSLSIAPSGSNFTLGGMDQFGNALAASMPFAWPTAGLTVQRSGNLLHLYQTGTTTDVTPAISAASLTNITVVGQDNVDETLTIDQSAGDLILLAGGSITYNGGALGSGSRNSLLTRSISGNDNAVLTAAQIALNSLTPIAYQNVKYFGFDLGAGTNGLLIDHATLTLNQDNAISIGTNVTVDGGMLDYNGHADAIGNLTLLGGGRVEATAVNNLTTMVTSGTLTAVSLICDTLIIGTPTATTNIAVPNTPAVKPAVGIAAAPIPSVPVSLTTTASLAVSTSPLTMQEVLTGQLTVVQRQHGDAASIPVTASSPEASVLADEKTAPSVNISLLAPWPTKSSTEKSEVAASPAHPLAEAKHSTVRTAKERMFSEPEAWDAMMHQLALRRASANRRMTRPSTLHDAAFSSFESETWDTMVR